MTLLESSSDSGFTGTLATPLTMATTAAAMARMPATVALPGLT